MKLRSGKLTKEYNKPPTRRRTPKMTNPSQNIDKIWSRNLSTTDLVISQVAPLPPVSNPTAPVSTAVSAPILEAPLASPDLR